MLGSSYVRHLSLNNIPYHTISRNIGSSYCIDLLHSFAEIEKLIIDNKYSAVINCAAIVSLDYCERFPSLAMRVNSDLVLCLASICEKVGSILMHISTDHFFSGDGNYLHPEDHPIVINNNYAYSKHLGELNALKFPNTIVLRTNVTGYRNGSSSTFIEWLLFSLMNNEPIILFDDFFTSTIDADCFVHNSLLLLECEFRGLLNLSSNQCISKYEFGLELSNFLNLDFTNVSIGSVVKLLPRRSNSLGLDCSFIESILKKNMPDTIDVLKSLTFSNISPD